MSAVGMSSTPNRALPSPSPAMNAVSTVLTANTLVPNTTTSIRVQAIWYTREQAPERKNRLRTTAFILSLKYYPLFSFALGRISIRGPYVIDKTSGILVQDPLHRLTLLIPSMSLQEVVYALYWLRQLVRLHLAGASRKLLVARRTPRFSAPSTPAGAAYRTLQPLLHRPPPPAAPPLRRPHGFRVRATKQRRMRRTRPRAERRQPLPGPVGSFDRNFSTAPSGRNIGYY